MNSTWELEGKSAGELTTTAEDDTWKNARKKAFRELVKKVNLSGFRPGQAPEKPVRKQASSQNILMEAIDEAVGDALSIGIKEHDLWVISRSALNIGNIDEDRVIPKFSVTVKPEVRPGAYKGLDITKEAAEVSGADVKEKIIRLQEHFTDLVMEEEGRVENGDTAAIDSEGLKRDVASEGGRGEAYPFAIGSGGFILGLEEQVLGVGVRETKGINVAFPEGYQAEEPVGQPVVLKTTVYKTKFKVLPEVDDESIKQVKIENAETLEVFREHSRKDLGENKKNQAEQKSESEILTVITENTEVEIPQIMVEEEADSLVRDFEQCLQSQGFGLEQFKRVAGQIDKMIRGEMDRDAFSKVRVHLALEAIAAGEKIEVSEENVNNGLENITNTYQIPVGQVEQLISNDTVSYDLRTRKALEFVKEATGK